MSRIEEMKKNAASRASDSAEAPKILKGIVIDAIPLLNSYSRYDVYDALYADARDTLSAVDIFNAAEKLLQPDIFIACDVGDENVKSFRRLVRSASRRAEDEMHDDLNRNASILCDAAANA